MRRKILIVTLTLSITLSLGNVPIKADSIDGINQIWKYQDEINLLSTNQETIDDEKIIVEVDGKATDRQIKKVLKGVAESYEVISGEFEIDEDLPKEKKERL